MSLDVADVRSADRRMRFTLGLPYVAGGRTYKWRGILLKTLLQDYLTCFALLSQIDFVCAMEQTTTIKFSFVLTTDVVEPAARNGSHTGYSATLLLSGKAVNEQWTSVKLSGANSDYYHDNGGLGGAWRVLSPNTIGASWRMLNYTKSVTVRVSGKSCSVSYATELDPGQALYRGKIDGAVYGYSRPVMTDPSCSIQ
jgi:hypothetical protein